MKEPIPLSVLHGGQSGDEVSLIRDELGTLVVQKKSGSAASRLGQQVQKIADFPHSEHIRVPKIVSPWDGSRYAMEYIPSRVLGDFIAVASLKEVTALGDALMGFIGERLSESPSANGVVADLASFAQKIEDLEQAHHSDPHRLRAVDELRRCSLDVPFLPGFNHGDFSFENVLIERQTNRVWLVDPIVSPIESPLIDLGRFILDLEHGWWSSFRSEKGSEKVARSMLLNSVRNLTESWGIDAASLRFFKQLAALRILPYTKDVGRSALLDEAISIGM